MRSRLISIVVLLIVQSALAADLGDPALRERWLQSLRDTAVPGAVIVAVRDGKTVLVQPLGLRDVEHKKPVTPDTAFYLASCTKSFMSMAMIALAEDGKIDLDAPVKKYLPQFQIADPKLTESITIRDLMCHRWGLESDHITFAEAFSGLINDELFYRLLKDVKPRGSFAYSNLHYTILGRVVQQVTGMSWKDYLAKRIFEPAGMTHATAYASKMYGSDDVALPYSHTFVGDPVPAPLRKTDRTMHAAGGMGASGNDLARWLILNINRGEIDGKRIISAQDCESMWQTQCPSPGTRKILKQNERLGYGLGWVVATYRDHRMLNHNGGYVGASAHISFLPDQKLGVAVVANTDAPAGWCDVIACDVYDKLLDVKDEDDIAEFKEVIDSHRRKAEGAEATTPKVTGKNPAVAKNGLSLKPEAYVGSYRHDTLGELQISLDAGKLSLALGELKPELLSTETDHFRSARTGVLIRDGLLEITDGKAIAVLITFEDGETARFARS